jgi:hypothetical protein
MFYRIATCGVGDFTPEGDICAGGAGLREQIETVVEDITSKKNIN